MRSVTMRTPRNGVPLFSRNHIAVGLMLACTCLISPFTASSDAAGPPRPESESPNETESSRRFAVAGFIGYGISHFEEQENWGGSSGFLPAGLQCLVNVSSHLSVGAELSHSILPFSWDVKSGGVKIADWSVSQTAISGFLKYQNRPHGRRPHARVGFGLYLSTGRSEFEEGWGRDYELEYQPGFGASMGLGLTGDWGSNRLYIMEAVYQVSYRRIDEDGAEHRWHNSLVIQIGAGLKL